MTEQLFRTQYPNTSHILELNKYDINEFLNVIDNLKRHVSQISSSERIQRKRFLTVFPNFVENISEIDTLLSINELPPYNFFYRTSPYLIQQLEHYPMNTEEVKEEVKEEVTKEEVKEEVKEEEVTKEEEVKEEEVENIENFRYTYNTIEQPKSIYHDYMFYFFILIILLVLLSPLNL
jgi:molecular chaperone GrpE (heat shock protein)